jgi:hypothetical protein
MTLYDYALHDPKGFCGDPRRGAAMGRSCYQDHPDDYSGPIRIRHIKIGSQGYDCLGTYFGHPPDSTRPYWVASPDCKIDYVILASSRSAAEKDARARWPNARIHKTPPSSRRHKHSLASVPA